jgi:sugar O-acyltransferase (sialic acid O-acetyltransferase NeuD family)
VDNSIYLFGYSGHAFVVMESLLSLSMKVLGYYDLKKAAEDPFALTYMGHEGKFDLSEKIGHSQVFVSVGNNGIRAGLVHHLESLKLSSMVVVDPTSHVSPSAQVLPFTYVGKKACINAGAQVGKGSILNTGSIVEHGCRIGPFTHVAPGAVLCGDVKVGERTLIGAGAVVKQGVHIGDDVIIGAGSVVLQDVPSGETWVGNPAKRLDQ